MLSFVCCYYPLSSLPQDLRQYFHPVQEAYCGCSERTSCGARSRPPAALRRGMGQRESLVPDAIHGLRADTRRVLHLHLPPRHGSGLGQSSHPFSLACPLTFTFADFGSGSGAGQRVAAERQEVDGSGSGL